MTEPLCDMATPTEFEPTAPKTWAELRAIVLYRDSYTCQTCGEPANEADHIWPKSKGGADKLSNLQALCRTCNRKKADRLFLHHVTTDRLADAIDHELATAAAAVKKAAWWLNLKALIEETDSEGPPTIDEMARMNGKADPGWDYSKALDMLAAIIADETDPAVLGALAYLGAHDDFPVYWDDLLDFPVVLGERRVRLGDLHFVDVLELLNACHGAGLSEQAAGVRVLVEMMCKESVLVVREIESGFVRGPVGVVVS